MYILKLIKDICNLFQISAILLEISSNKNTDICILLEISAIVPDI